ncbi:MAG TPA: helix-turn-helix transcriptional regulator [Candidatus Binatia bacterium]|jgi:DNA-binding CsgD family transcriptional regulator/PAS domain-containing protein|nr:helix-turn-helix transcriptional regulator [Candidatus Binatia bacterium]
MVRSDALLDLLGVVYDAATDATGWERCLAALADALNCPAVGLFPMDPVSASTRITHNVGHDPAALVQYDAHYGRPDVNAYASQITPAHLVPGAVLRAEDVCNDAALLRTEYWSDWLRPQDLGAGGFGILASPGGGLLILSVARARRIGRLESDEIGLLRAVLPHLQRAIEVQERLERLQADGEAAVVALDHLPSGVILLDECGQPLLINRRARALLDAGDGLSVSRDGLHGLDGDTTARLRRMIGAAVDTGRGQAMDGGDALSLPRRDGTPPLQVLVTPIGRHRYRIGAQFAAAAVFVGDPARVIEPPPAVLRHLYGLTAAEASLAMLLVNGRSPEEAATELGVSIHTVRTQLKHVLGKTGARRQAELMRLFLLGPAGLGV